MYSIKYKAGRRGVFSLAAFTREFVVRNILDVIMYSKLRYKSCSGSARDPYIYLVYHNSLQTFRCNKMEQSIAAQDWVQVPKHGNWGFEKPYSEPLKIRN